MMYLVGLLSGLVLATIIFIGAFSFRADIKKGTNEVKKVLPQNKGGFIEPVELSDKIKELFTK